MTTKRKRSSGAASSSSSSTASASPSAPTPSGGSGELFQVVEVLLSDGRVGQFMGPVLVEDETALSVKTVRFFRPQPLPQGCRFALLGDLLNEEMEVAILPDGNGVVCTHRVHGCIGRFDPVHHEYAVPGDEERELRFSRVAHEDRQVLHHHWNHFVDRMGRWGLDVRAARPEYVSCEPSC